MQPILAFEALLTKSARGNAVIGAERAAEMRGVVEAPAEADLADRQIAVHPAGEIRATMLETALPQI